MLWNVTSAEGPCPGGRALSNSEECSPFRCESKFVSQTQHSHHKTSITSSLSKMVRKSSCQHQTLHLITMFLNSDYHITELFTPCLHSIFKLTHAKMDSQQEWSHKDENNLRKSIDCWRVNYLVGPAQAGAAPGDFHRPLPASTPPWLSDLWPICDRIMLILLHSKHYENEYNPFPLPKHTKQGSQTFLSQILTYKFTVLLQMHL